MGVNLPLLRGAHASAFFHDAAFKRGPKTQGRGIGHALLE
jgi:hypothetical protein